MEGDIKLGRSLVSFIFWPVGIITYFEKKDQDRKAANKYLTITLISVSLTVLAALGRRR